MVLKLGADLAQVPVHGCGFAGGLLNPYAGFFTGPAGHLGGGCDHKRNQNYEYDDYSSKPFCDMCSSLSLINLFWGVVSSLIFFVS